MEITKWLHPFLKASSIAGKGVCPFPDTGTLLNRPPAHLLANVMAVTCSRPSSVSAIVLAVRFGTFIARNTNVFTTFDNCIARAGNRSAVSDCIARFANDVRP